MLGLDETGVRVARAAIPSTGGLNMFQVMDASALLHGKLSSRPRAFYLCRGGTV